jgi:hypothetical protein
LLRDDTTGFAIITSTDEVPLRDAIGLRRTLEAERMPLVGCFVNRVRTQTVTHESLGSLSQRLRDAAREDDNLDAEMRGWIEQCADSWAAATQDYALAAQRDHQQIERLQTEFGRDADRVTAIPLFSKDICDMSGLAAFADIVVGR